MKIDFEIVKDGYVYRDAIVLPDDHSVTDDQIEAMRQARFDAWYAVVTAEEPAIDPAINTEI
jgi:hypothetical protein